MVVNAVRRLFIMLLCWSRDDLLAFSRLRCVIDQSLRETASRLGLHRRGRRAGRRRRQPAAVVTSLRSRRPASNVNKNSRSADQMNQHHDRQTLAAVASFAARPIPVVIDSQRPTQRQATARHTARHCRETTAGYSSTYKSKL